MPAQIINRRPEYRPVDLIAPSSHGYIHLAGRVHPPGWPPVAVPPMTGLAPRLLPADRRRRDVLRRLKGLAQDVAGLDVVNRACVFEAIAIPPVRGAYLRKRPAAHLARFDVAALVETTSPEILGPLQDTPAYRALERAIVDHSQDHHVMVGRNAKRVADVDTNTKGLYLFNYFTGDDQDVTIELWDHLAGWYAAETGLDNSTLLVPLSPEDADYHAINFARWDLGLPRFLTRQLPKKTFRTFVTANLAHNDVAAMPIMYRLI